jgi:hypothetical protein
LKVDNACNAAIALFNLLFVHITFERILLYQARSKSGLIEEPALRPVPEAAGRSFT